MLCIVSSTLHQGPLKEDARRGEQAASKVLHGMKRPPWQVWAGIGIIAWAAALQANLWSMQKETAYKEKFDDAEPGSPQTTVRWSSASK